MPSVSLFEVIVYVKMETGLFLKKSLFISKISNKLYNPVVWVIKKSEPEMHFYKFYDQQLLIWIVTAQKASIHTLPVFFYKFFITRFGLIWKIRCCRDIQTSNSLNRGEDWSETVWQRRKEARDGVHLYGCFSWSLQQVHISGGLNCFIHSSSNQLITLPGLSLPPCSRE